MVAIGHLLALLVKVTYTNCGSNTAEEARVYILKHKSLSSLLHILLPQSMYFHILKLITAKKC